MKRSLMKNYFYNLMYDIFALIVPLITTPYISRVLGATAIGEYGFTSGVVSYFGIIAALGTVNYAKREIAYRQNDEMGRSKIFYEIFIFRIITTLAVSILYLIFIFTTDQSLRNIYMVQWLSIISWFFDISWLYQGMEDFKITAIRNSLVKLVGTVLIFIFVKKQNDLWIYILILCGSNLIGNLSTWLYIKRYIKKIPFKEINIFKHTRGIIALFVPIIAIQIYTILDQTMLGVIANNTEVGYYTQAQKIIKLALVVISAFGSVLMPRIAILINTKMKNEVNNLIRQSMDYLFMLALPMMIGCICIADHFVPVFFGNGYEPVVPLLQYLSVLFVILGAGQFAGNILISMKKHRQYTFAVCIGAVINFLLNLILIGKLYSLGAVISSIFAEICVTLIEVWNVHKSYSLYYGLKAFLRYLWPALLMCIAILFTKSYLSADLISLIIEMTVGVCVYGGILLIRKDELLYEVLQKVLKK